MLRVEREHSVARANVFENGCVSSQDMERGMDVMNVVVRETGSPCKATDLELLGLVEVYSPALML